MDCDPATRPWSGRWCRDRRNPSSPKLVPTASLSPPHPPACPCQQRGPLREGTQALFLNTTFCSRVTLSARNRKHLKKKKKKRKKSFVKMVLADWLQFSFFPAVAKTTSFCTLGAQKNRPSWMVKPTWTLLPRGCCFQGAREQGRSRGCSKVAAGEDPAWTPPQHPRFLQQQLCAFIHGRNIKLPYWHNCLINTKHRLRGKKLS